jgi:hypothetical protein
MTLLLYFFVLIAVIVTVLVMLRTSTSWRPTVLGMFVAVTTFVAEFALAHYGSCAISNGHISRLLARTC